MVERVARELIYLSRSAQQSPEVGTFFDELVTMGCKVHLVARDVTKPEDVSRLRLQGPTR